MLVVMTETNLVDANLTGCNIYGMSAWDLKLHGAKQRGSVEELVQGLDEEIIQPALARFDELLVKKAEKLRVRRIGT